MNPRVADHDFALYHGDAADVLAVLPDATAAACVTSPPYVDTRPEYPGVTPEAWRRIWRELARVVAGPSLVNVGRVWRKRIESTWWLDVLLAARENGLELLDTLVWVKPNANPIRGELLADSHEYVFIIGRPGVTLNIDDARTPYAPESLARMRRRSRRGTVVKGVDRETAGREPHPAGARPRSYFEAYTGREKGNPHPAPMCEALADHLVTLAAPAGAVIIDPFAGSGTTALACRKLGRRCVAIELDDEYAELCAARLSQQALPGAA